MALTSLTYLKPLLGIAPSDTSQDAALQSYLDAADREVKTYCGRDFEQQAYTEFYSGQNQPRLALRQIPVTAVSQVLLDNSGFFGTNPGGAFDPALSTLTEGKDFVLDRDPSSSLSKSGILIRLGTVWPMLTRWMTMNRLAPDLAPAPGNIKVTYTAGYSSIPADLQMATAMVAVNMRRMLPFGGNAGVHREKLGDYSYELFGKLLLSIELGSVRTILARYREIGW